MGWKNWPSWLKLGMILTGIYIILTIILLPFGITDCGGQGLCLWTWPSIGWIIVYPLLNLVKPSEGGFSNSIIIPIMIIVSIIFYFIFGVIISWIIGKFKKYKSF